ncbi:cell cycle control protein 50C [Macaca nemestrina]|uniref:Cell cycle control protein n=2 Tax=Macaca TaxID=9539 RepID=A0A2K5X5X5_MACFA|nr:cell cycle control protein 50C [Macaca fascicularis]XP_011732283.1 cell cycle control protein 50C [Macaca nemestrina]XP_050638042.1 cell cycle control protein 50C [Macaca thibetana thibetana]
MEETPQHCLSRLPDNSALKQQELPAHRLYFTARRVLFVFFTTGIFCLCMGIILILSARSTQEIEINYTRICANCAKLRENASNFDKECTCSIPFYLSGKMMGNVYMYYKLYGFYQNLYRYVRSRSNRQLVGKDVKAVEDCAPFKMSDNKTPIVPCGAIANSMFNDTIILSHNINSSVQIKVPMLKSGLTWWTDKYVKFQNPSSKNLADEFRGTTKPPNWPKPIYDLDKKDPRNNGFLNDDFIVWMRAAAFPTFKKLYGRLNRTHHFIEGLPAGNYSFNITYNFPVTRFQGEKSVVLSTLTWCGGNSLFLGLAYTVTGAITWLASFAMMAIHITLKNKQMSFFHQ